MNLYELSVPQFKKMLRTGERWLDTLVAYADRKKFDPKVLLTARLAPDQWAFTRQLTSACDTAKFACAPSWSTTGRSPRRSRRRRTRSRRGGRPEVAQAGRRAGSLIR